MQYSRKQILQISDCTTNFYKTVSDSFSKTRSFSWTGWNMCLPHIQNLVSDKPDNCISITDIACGNLRFKNFLDENLQNATYSMQAIDNSTLLVGDYAGNDTNVKFINLDIVQSLLNDNFMSSFENSDLIVSFGLMHHIPSYDLRLKLLDSLYKKLNDNGVLIVSFWQFLNDDKLSKKADEATKLAKNHLFLNCLEENDYFLSWQDNKDVFRFCHHFSDNEIKSLSKDLKSNIVDCFLADGADNKLNKYIVFSK